MKRLEGFDSSPQEKEEKIELDLCDSLVRLGLKEAPLFGCCQWKHRLFKGLKTLDNKSLHLPLGLLVL
jgi:hypothetical protein